MLQMFYIIVWGKAIDPWNSDEMLDNLYALADSPVMLNITWRLDHPIPAKYLKKTNKLVVG